VIKFRVLNIASALLFIVGIIGVLFGLVSLLFVPIDEGLLGVTVSEIRAFNTNVMDQITLSYQFSGLYLLATGLLSCIIALLWAWYTQLVVGGLALFGQFIIVYIGSALLPAFYLPLAIILIILWLVGMVLPVKKILS